MSQRKRFRRVLVNKGRKDAQYWHSASNHTPNTWRNILREQGVDVVSITPLVIEYPMGVNPKTFEFGDSNEEAPQV